MFDIFELKEGHKMFLVRSAFWLSVVILLLPAENQQENTKLGKAPEKVTAGQAFVAAQSTVDDLSGFCLRNQTACDTGKAAMDMFVRKAQYGAGLLNDWVSGISSANAAPVKPDNQLSLYATGAKKIAAPAGNGQLIQLAGKDHASQQTLTNEDLRPAWGGPKSKRKA